MPACFDGDFICHPQRWRGAYIPRATPHPLPCQPSRKKPRHWRWAVWAHTTCTMLRHLLCNTNTRESCRMNVCCVLCVCLWQKSLFRFRTTCVCSMMPLIEFYNRTTLPFSRYICVHEGPMNDAAHTHTAGPLLLAWSWPWMSIRCFCHPPRFLGCFGYFVRSPSIKLLVLSLFFKERTPLTPKNFAGSRRRMRIVFVYSMVRCGGILAAM